MNVVTIASSGQNGGGNGRWRPPDALLTPDEFGGKGRRTWRMRHRLPVN